MGLCKARCRIAASFNARLDPRRSLNQQLGGVPLPPMDAAGLKIQQSIVEAGTVNQQPQADGPRDAQRQ